MSARPAVAVWSPLPPSPSGIADYVAEQLPALTRHADVRAVAQEPDASAERTVVNERGGASPRGADDASAEQAADLDVYHVGNSPAHAWVYRAALRRPGVVVLHDWSLHQLVLCETVERGDVSSYLREMRRAHGETGSFVGRQVARALGGSILPALYPVNERLLEGALAIVALSQSTAARVAGRLPGRPLLHLRHHLSLPLDPLPSRAEARRTLGLGDGPILTAPGLATATKGLQAAVQAAARLRAKHPGLRLVVAGGVEPGLALADWARGTGLGDGLVVTGRLDMADFVRHLCAADVVLALRFPSYGEMSGALVRALGVGRPALVTAGTPAAEEFPEGIVAVVDPGPAEELQLEAIVDHLLAHPQRAETMGREAAAYIRAHHDLERTTAVLAAFLADVAALAPQARSALLAERAADTGRLGFFLDEVRPGARELGLSAAGLGIEALLRELAGEVR